MHAADLSPMRESLTDFLMAWMGGPRDWFEKRPGACVMSAHRALEGMNYATATQWVLAMQQAAKPCHCLQAQIEIRVERHDHRQAAMRAGIRQPKRLVAFRGGDNDVADGAVMPVDDQPPQGRQIERLRGIDTDIDTDVRTLIRDLEG